MGDLQTSIAALLRADFTAEEEAGFPNVRRIPSTDAVKLVDYFATLDAAGGVALLNALAHGNALQFLLPPLAYREGLELSGGDPALTRYRDAMRSGHFAYGLRYQDIRMAKIVLKDRESMARMAETRSTLGFVPRDDPPTELMPEPDRLKVETAKAPLLRKLIEKAFAQLFSPSKSKLAGGELRYTGRIESTELTVSVIFSNMYGQMHWWVNMKMANPNLRAIHVKDFWGHAGWDYLTEENAPRSIDLLCERIVLLANLRERIDNLGI